MDHFLFFIAWYTGSIMASDVHHTQTGKATDLHNGKTLGNESAERSIKARVTRKGKRNNQVKLYRSGFSKI